MAKKKEKREKEMKVYKIELDGVKETEQVETEHPQPEEPKDEKKKIMENFIHFYATSVKGRSTVPAAVGKEIVKFFNDFSGSRVIYNGCGSCIGNKINYMRKQAAEKYNLIF